MQFTKTAISAAALLALVQFSPAPQAVFAAVFGGVATLIGGITDVAIHATHPEIGKREAIEIIEARTPFNSRVKRTTPAQTTDNAPNKLAWQECLNQLAAPGVTVTFSYPSPGSLLTAGVPSACMTLSGVLTGTYNEGNPVPQGSDSILFNGLSDQDFTDIQNALAAHPSTQK